MFKTKITCQVVLVYADVCLYVSRYALIIVLSNIRESFHVGMRPVMVHFTIELGFVIFRQFTPMDAARALLRNSDDHRHGASMYLSMLVSWYALIFMCVRMFARADTRPATIHVSTVISLFVFGFWRVVPAAPTAA